MQENKILGRKTVYKGKAFAIESVTMQFPNSKQADFDLVKHVGAVTIVPMDSKGNLHFVRQYRVGAERLLLEFPAGTLGKNEDPFDCAKREIREEIGMRAEKWTKLGDFYMAPGYSSEWMTIYLAEELTLDPLPGDEDEFLEVEKYPIKDVLEMVKTNQIHDGKTLAAMALALPFLAA